MVSSMFLRGLCSISIYLMFLCNQHTCQENSPLSNDDIYKRKIDMYKFHGTLGKRQDEVPIPEDQFEKRKMDYARFFGTLGKRSEFENDVDKRVPYDRYRFATLGKRFVDTDDMLSEDKRRLDRLSYFGALGKRGMDRLSYFGSLGKRGIDRHAFFGNLGKRRMDRLAYFGALGKRNSDERYNTYNPFMDTISVSEIIPARGARSWLSRNSNGLPVSIRGIDKYSLFGSLGKRSFDQEELEDSLDKR